MMLAHDHAQVWSASELARAFAVAHTTVQRYLDLRFDCLYVVHAGAQSFDLAGGIKAIAFARLLEDLPTLR